MTTYQPGDPVRIVENHYYEKGGRSFIGETGTIRTAKQDSVTIAGLDGPSSDQSYWFEIGEVEKA